MSWIECSSCEEMVDVCGNTVRLPYICGRCEKDAALAIEEDNVLCDVPYNSGVPCQSALDSVQNLNIDPYGVGETDPRVHDIHMDVLDQFDAYTEVIHDLRMQLDEAHAANASLTEEIELYDRRVRTYQRLSAEVDKHATGLEGAIEILKSELRGISIRANDAVLDTCF